MTARSLPPRPDLNQLKRQAKELIRRQPQHQTLLHLVCQARDYRGRNRTDGALERAAILLDAGANMSARDEEYRSTPLAWAARTNAVEMVEFLLAREAPTNLPHDESWATPLAWAERRQHAEIVSILRRHGAA